VYDILRAVKWKVSRKFYFRQKSHVNLQETRALSAELKELAIRCEAACRSVNIVDSRVGLGAVAKGRSSSHKLNGVLRSFIPYSIAGQKSLVDVWGATDENVADDPTRHRSVRTPDPSAAPWLQAHYPQVPVREYSLSEAAQGDGDGYHAGS